MAHEVKGAAAGRICVSIARQDIVHAIQAARKVQAMADVIEIRLDSLSVPAVDPFLQAIDVPLLFTNRPAWEGGHFYTTPKLFFLDTPFFSIVPIPASGLGMFFCRGPSGLRCIFPFLTFAFPKANSYQLISYRRCLLNSDDKLSDNRLLKGCADVCRFTTGPLLFVAVCDQLLILLDVIGNRRFDTAEAEIKAVRFQPGTREIDSRGIAVFR
jgi:hypothetical protein